MDNEDGFAILCETVDTLSAQVTALITINRVLIETHQNRQAFVALLAQKENEIAAILNGEPVPDQTIAKYLALVSELREFAQRN